MMQVVLPGCEEKFLDRSSATSNWIKFFIEAGLPSNVAANYAIIFTDHRIQLDMLLDLSKEYLFDMGIRTLGDIIAILRHAKVAHNQAVKEKLIMSDTVQAGSSPNSRRSTPASRMVGHYTRRVNEMPEMCNKTTIKLEKKTDDSEMNRKDKGTVISLKRKPVKESPLPVKKIRRVLPEHEGTYKVTMPSGTTKKTRKILQQQGLDVVGKRSVFDRLGESAVSSSTDVIPVKQISSVFERLGPSKTSVNKQGAVSTSPDDDSEAVSPLPYQGVLKVNNVTKVMPTDTIKITKVLRKSEDQAKSVITINKTNVMNRLGPKTSVMMKTSRIATSSEPPSLIIRKSIFDAQVSQKKMAVISPTTTAGILGSDSDTRRLNVKTRLGHIGLRQLTTNEHSSEQTRRTVTSNTFGKTNIINTKRAVISPSSETRNVFQRLGPSTLNV